MVRLIKTEHNVPFYSLETPPPAYVTYREVWHGQLIKEIYSYFEAGLNGSIYVKGSKFNLELVAERGWDEIDRTGIGGLIYVCSTRLDDPFINELAVGYAFWRARSGILLYDGSKLRETNDGLRRALKLNFNRFEFLTDPKEALLGIIDMRELRKLEKKTKFEAPQP